MNNKKTTKRALLSSVMAIVLCLAMLIGTTFAWFTDSASTAVNKIQAGTLDVQLLDESGRSLEGQTLAWQKAAGHDNDEVLWEPGCTYQLQPIVIKNNGNLALKYKIVITGIRGDAKLNEAIEWTITNTSTTTALDEDHPLAAGAFDTLTISGQMKDSAGNEYQGLSIDGIAITVVATQLGGSLNGVNGENDSFNNIYDQNATYPEAVVVIPAVENKPLTAETNAAGQTIYKYSNPSGSVKVSVPTVAEGVTAQVSVVPTAAPTNANVSAEVNNEGRAVVAYEINMSNVTLGDGNLATFDILVGKDLTDVKLYHSDVAMTSVDTKDELDAADEFYYNAETGFATFMVSHLSPFTAAYNKPVASIGSTAYYNLQDALNVGGEVNLLRDVKIDATKTSAADRLMVKVPTTLNFNDKKLIAPGELEPTANWAGLYIGADTVINATENGGIQCNDKENGECGTYVANIVNGANVTVNGGTYYGGGTTFQVQKGTLTINGGHFEVTSFGAPYNYDFLLNCVDSNYKNGTAKIIVNGGSFKTFDPANNKSEGAGTNYVVDGKGTVKNGDWYEVISGTFVSTEKELKAALLGNDTTIYLTKDIELNAPITIGRDCTLVGNGSATISAHPVSVAPTANVTFKNVNFATPDNASNNASSVYASGLEGKVVFDGCTFTNPQWECIQITPMDGAEIIATNCKFVVDGNATYAQANGKKVERLFHIQNTKATGKYKATITNNQFIGVDLCRNSVIDVDDIAAFANVTCGGNTFADHYGTSVSTLADGKIYVNINGRYTAAYVATDTYAQFTQTPAAALHH